MPKKPEHKLDIDTLVIEVTRRCNMACAHCLRGHAQETTMRADILRRLLKQTAHVGQVVFTGGEPCLEINVIRRFYEITDRLGVPVDSFYVATNGTVNQAQLASVLLVRYEKAEYPEACAVSVSRDPYHSGPPQSRLLEGLKFYDGQKEHGPDDGEKWVIPGGRAYENGIGAYNTALLDNVSSRFSLSVDVNDDVEVDMLYVSANGMAYPDCNLSYDDMDAAVDDPDSAPTETVPVKGCARVLFDMASERQAA